MTDQSSDGEIIAAIDLRILIYLFERLPAAAAPVANARAALLTNLCEWLGGAGWLWVARPHPETERARVSEAIHSSSVEMVTQLLESLDDPGLDAATAARRLWQVRGGGQGGDVLVAIYRTDQQAPFTVRESLLGRIVLEEVPWLYQDDSAPRLRGRPEIPALSPRQQMVLEHLLLGWDRKKIASHLSISLNTLADHVKEIYRLFGVRSQTHLLKLNRPSHD